MEVKSISEIIQEVSPYYSKKGEPECEHKLVYDSPAEALEPVYFWILEFLQEVGMDVEKLVDTFSSTPGGSHFSEVGTKATRMQEEGMKIMANANAVLRSILNIVYDLKEFKTRLQHYEGLSSKDKAIKEASKLSLKQIWMDKVDIAKGNSSIKAMALGQAGFQTLIDAFLVIDKAEDVDKIDLNDRVKRILRPRIQDFNIWVDQSEKELKKRYELEKNYLKSQVNNLKIYSKWAKPYFRAAQQLSMKDPGRNPSLVNLFNTAIMNLTLFGKSEMKPEKLAGEDLPLDFKKIKTNRKYYSCVLIEINFKAIPQQGRFTGKAEVVFKGYGLNEDEIEKFYQELEKTEIEEGLNLIEGATDESLSQIQKDIDEVLKEEPKKKEEKKKTMTGSNPFLALIGYYDKKEKPQEKEEKKKEKPEKVKSDDWLEKEHLRKYVTKQSEEKCFLIFNTYKKAHGMSSYK